MTNILEAEYRDIDGCCRVIDIIFSLLAKGYYSIQHPNKIVNTVCPLVGLLKTFSVKTLDNND